jgi:predicted dehydrogenase
MSDHGSALRGALIGCGYVSQFHIAAWQHVENARIVAFCDADSGRVERAASHVPGARTYTSAVDLFQSEKSLDFVEICTLPESHVELVRLAAAHGAHVLCQKPAAVDRDQFIAMIDACAAASVRFMIHENWRYRPWYRALKQALYTKAIGRPIRLRIAHRDTRALRQGGFAEQPYLARMPRLILMDMGCHLVDTARYLMGEIESVAATTGRFGRENAGEDVAMLTVKFNSGALGLLDFTWCAAADRAKPEWALNETVVEGSEGALRLLTDGSLELVRISGAVERVSVRLPQDNAVYLDGYAATQQHFIEGIRSGHDLETSGVDNLKTMEVVWAAYRSADESRTIAL